MSAWEPVKVFITSEAAWVPNRHTVIWKVHGNILVCLTSQRGLWKPCPNKRELLTVERSLEVSGHCVFRGSQDRRLSLHILRTKGTCIHYSDFRISLSGY